jgi:hypothetical protein
VTVRNSRGIETTNGDRGISGTAAVISPFTRNLALFSLVNLVLFNAVLVGVFDQPLERTSWQHFHDLLSLDLTGDDSWRPMTIAFDYVQSAPPEERKPLYDRVFFEQNVKFQYAPTSLLVFHGLQALGVARSSWNQVLNRISAVLVVITALAAWGILEYGLRRRQDRLASTSVRLDWMARGVLVIGLTGTFYPVAKSFTQGQLQTWINCLFAALLWCWLKDKRGASGVLAGLICLWKPQFLILLAWGVLRRQWRFVAPFAGVGLAGLLISVRLAGVDDHVNYLSVLAHLSRLGEAYYPNQSVNGLLNRLLSNGSSLNFDSTTFPPFHAVVYAGTLAGSVLLIVPALFWPIRAGGRGSATDLALVALTGTMASPIAWEHHYGVLLPIYAYLLPRLLSEKVFGRLTLPVLAVSYLLASNFIFVTNGWATSEYLQPFRAASLLQSYLFAGALMALACLYTLRTGRLWSGGRGRVSGSDPRVHEGAVEHYSPEHQVRTG